MEEYLINFYHLNDDNEEAPRICWFRCKAFGEMIHFLQACKKYQIDFYIREDDESIPDKYKNDYNLPKYIDDFNVNYGSDDCMQTIDVYLK